MHHLIRREDGKWKTIDVDWCWGHSHSWADHVKAKNLCTQLNGENV